jgi:hypothetical protein
VKTYQSQEIELPASDLLLHILFEVLVIITYNVSGRCVLADKVQDLGDAITAVLIATTRSGAAHFGCCFPHELREMARLIAETSGWVVIIHAAFIRP